MIRSWMSCVYTCNDPVLAFMSLVWPWKIRCSLAPEMNKSKKVSIPHHTSRSLPLTSDTRKQLSLSSLWKTLYTCRPGSCIWSWSIQVLMKTDHTTRRQKHQTNLNLSEHTCQSRSTSKSGVKGRNPRSGSNISDARNNASLCFVKLPRGSPDSYSGMTDTRNSLGAFAYKRKHRLLLGS